MAKQPTVLVCAGGGGVGKTTSSSALALALARGGKRALVVTIDPARRLADALGVPVSPTAHPVRVEEGLEDRLYALMPEPRTSTQTFIDFLFEGQPEALARFNQNRVYRMLADAAAGMHEIVCMTIVAREVSIREYDYVIIDTAPSRYALDFVSYPSRMAALLESKAMSFIGGLAGNTDDDSPSGPAGWAKKRVEGMLGKVLGASFIGDLSGMFTELIRVRERFALLARQAEELVLGASTRYILVAAPTGAALADARFLAKRLEKLQRTPQAILLNRADSAPRPWVRLLLAHPPTPPAMRQALMQLDSERSARTVAADDMDEELARTHSHLARIRLPLIEARNPADIVKALATELSTHLTVLAGSS